MRRFGVAFRQTEVNSARLEEKLEATETRRNVAFIFFLIFGRFVQIARDFRYFGHLHDLETKKEASVKCSESKVTRPIDEILLHLPAEG